MDVGYYQIIETGEVMWLNKLCHTNSNFILRMHPRTGRDLYSQFLTIEPQGSIWVSGYDFSGVTILGLYSIYSLKPLEIINK